MMTGEPGAACWSGLSRKQLEFLFNVHFNWIPLRAHDHQFSYSIRIVTFKLHYTACNETGVTFTLDVTVTGGGGGGGGPGTRQTAACRFELLWIKNHELRLFTTTAVRQIMTSPLLPLE